MLSEHRERKSRRTIATAASDRGQVELAVSDSGAGVPAENRDRVFDAFFATSRTEMGMGLAIHSLVDDGGRLWLTPNSARGCTFRYRARGRRSIVALSRNEDVRSRSSFPMHRSQGGRAANQMRATTSVRKLFAPFGRSTW